MFYNEISHVLFIDESFDPPSLLFSGNWKRHKELQQSHRIICRKKNGELRIIKDIYQRFEVTEKDKEFIDEVEWSNKTW